MVQSCLKWVGGKSASAEKIVKAFPDPTTYDTYVETCGGAAHVFLCRSPYNHKEVYNDADNNLVNYWEVMQVQANEVQQRLSTLLYSRKLYYTYYRSLFDGTDLEPLERAVRWFYVLRSTGTGWMRRSPVGWNYHASNAQAYYNALDLFEAISVRMRGVVIDNRDVLATIKRYDSPRTFFYIDPPYFDAEQYYEASKKGFPHHEMATLLHYIKGQAAVSYYPHPNIDDWYKDWRRTTWQQHKSSAIADGCSEEMQIATEMLLCNYDEPVASLWDEVSA